MENAKFWENFLQKIFTSFEAQKQNFYSTQFFFIVFFVFVCSSHFFSQNQPLVENVTFSQRTDGSHTVDIYYDVQLSGGGAMTVTMEVSDDNGLTWNFPCLQITGDVGAGVTSGTGKHIVWNFGAEHPNKFEDQMRIKITATSAGGGVPCPGIPTVTYAGKTYNTVLIGEQCWLKENLDVGVMIQGSQNATNNGVIEKYCYNNNPNNCNTYGGLYQWNEAMQYSTTPGTQGICPTGWHMPTTPEIVTLFNTVSFSSNALKAIGQGTGGGAGTNTSGFSALLAGSRSVSSGFTYLGENAFFFHSTESSSLAAENSMLKFDDNWPYTGAGHKGLGLSIRCLKD